MTIDLIAGSPKLLCKLPLFRPVSVACSANWKRVLNSRDSQG
jgi:hypothetical protein